MFFYVARMQDWNFNLGFMYETGTFNADSENKQYNAK